MVGGNKGTWQFEDHCLKGNHPPPPPPPNFDQVVVIVEKQGTAKSLTENPHRVRGRRKRLKISNHSLVVPWTMGPKDD